MKNGDSHQSTQFNKQIKMKTTSYLTVVTVIVKKIIYKEWKIHLTVITDHQLMTVMIVIDIDDDISYINHISQIIIIIIIFLWVTQVHQNSRQVVKVVHNKNT